MDVAYLVGIYVCPNAGVTEKKFGMYIFKKSFGGDVVHLTA